MTAHQVVIRNADGTRWQSLGPFKTREIAEEAIEPMRKRFAHQRQTVEIQPVDDTAGSGADD